MAKTALAAKVAVSSGRGTRARAGQPNHEAAKRSGGACLSASNDMHPPLRADPSGWPTASPGGAPLVAGAPSPGTM